MKTHFISVFIVVLVSSFLHAQEKKYPTLQVNGRIQTDFEILKRSNSSELLRGFEFRRLYVSFKGFLRPRISYKIETDIAHAHVVFKDVYIKFHGGNWGNLSIGSVAEPAGLEMNTSSKYIPFNERSMLTSLQNGRWGAGIHYENYRLLSGRLYVQAAITGNGKASEGFKDKELDKGLNYVFRISGTPVYASGQTLHLGLNMAYRPPASLSFRPENHMGDKYVYHFPDSIARNEVGGELAWIWKSLTLASEYKTQYHINNAGKDFRMTGYYAMASFFLTGESRPYKHGSFSRVRPKKDITQGGPGAVELLVRFSQMNATPDIHYDNPNVPESIGNVTFGLNWYLTSHLRFMYNFVITDDQNNMEGILYAHLIRLHLDF